MPSLSQRAVLVIAAVLALAIVRVVPLIDGGGSVVAFGSPTTRLIETSPEQHYFESVKPGYAMMGAEFAALAFATTCLVLASGRKRE